MAGFTPQKRAERIALLNQIADSLFSDGVLDEASILLRRSRIALSVDAYIALNDAYKDLRIEDGHFTEEPKIAALHAITIARVQPFRPLAPNAVATTAEARCNEIFALAAANVILGTTINPIHQNFILRLLDVISQTSCETVEPVIVDAGLQILPPEGGYRLAVLSTDQLSINSLITIFELISGKYD